MTLFGKSHHVLSRLFWREPSLALGCFSSTNFASKDNTCLVRTQRKNLHSPLFDKNIYLLAQGPFGRDGEGTFGGKNDRPKSSKSIFFFFANAMHKAKYGRALNETGTVELRRQAAHRSGTSEWNCCRLLCGFLFRFAQLFVLRCLKKNQNAPRPPSEHPPVREETFGRWDHRL